MALHTVPLINFPETYYGKLLQRNILIFEEDNFRSFLKIITEQIGEAITLKTRNREVLGSIIGYPYLRISWPFSVPYGIFFIFSDLFNELLFWILRNYLTTNYSTTGHSRVSYAWDSHNLISRLDRSVCMVSHFSLT